MNILEGKLVSEGNPKIAIVAARFNEFIVSKLIEGARDGLLRHDVKEENIDLCWVPGSFEIPVAAKHLAESKISARCFSFYGNISATICKND